MKHQLLDYFRCPYCDSGLCVQDTNPTGDVTESEVLICRNCEKSFPIQNNIPRFVLSQNYATSFGFQWNAHRKTQLDSFTGLTISRDRLFKTTGWLENLEGQLVLEAGSGAGRFTEILLRTGARIFSFDYSSLIIIIS